MISTEIPLKLPPKCTPVNPSIPVAGLGDKKSFRAANWQNSGDYGQPDPPAGLDDTKSTRASLARYRGPSRGHRVSRAANPDRSRDTKYAEQQILALMVRASPKLVRQSQVH
ncbi:hypothetical protein Prudu_1476S000100 [Prunus dulcis]|uniref:Uncharacterized protein n=1 Tax=Prunus dulcis TaxID=3755 RepID=A0A5H2XRL1_PRUDU|nr:hypothetical protein Prudu_1476S000100 [Prunus dulcis]